MDKEKVSKTVPQFINIYGHHIPIYPSFSIEPP